MLLSLKTHSCCIRLSMEQTRRCPWMVKGLLGGQTTASNTETPVSALWRTPSTVATFNSSVVFKQCYCMMQTVENPDICLMMLLSDTVKPLFWPNPAYELDLTDSNNNGFTNQDFLVWMRRAALPNFRKLYRRITQGDYAQGLPAGNYTLKINYSILLHKYIIRLFKWWSFDLLQVAPCTQYPRLLTQADYFSGFNGPSIAED